MCMYRVQSCCRRPHSARVNQSLIELGRDLQHLAADRVLVHFSHLRYRWITQDQQLGLLKEFTAGILIRNLVAHSAHVQRRHGQLDRLTARVVHHRDPHL